MLLHEEVAQLQEEVHLLRQMKDMLSKDLEESQGGSSANLLSATELRVQLVEKEQDLDRAKETLQGQETTQVFYPPHKNPYFLEILHPLRDQEQIANIRGHVFIFTGFYWIQYFINFLCYSSGIQGKTNK